MIKLLVVDNHPITRKGIELIFVTSPSIQVVGSLGDGKVLFEFLLHHEVDVVLCELDLPKFNGISVLRRLKNDYPNIKPLVFTAESEDVYALNALKAGAKGFLPKTANILTIKEAIDHVASGKTYLSPELAEKVKKKEESTKSGAYYKKLSTRETEVLRVIAKGKKNKEIATELNINEKTVSTYKSRLMKKLDVTNIVDLINRAKLIQLN